MGRRVTLVIFIFAYLVLHIVTLSVHPFVHSDEAWLAVLTRAMITQGTPAATEEVFRLTPRYPHALKTLYHALQMPFIAISWSALAARLPSLIAGCFALVGLFSLAGGLGLKRTWKFLPVLLLAADPQFWYLSHLGRQEMLLIALFLWSWALRVKRKEVWLAALPMAASILVHPNAFVLILPLAAMYALDILKERSSASIRKLAVFSGVIAFAAVLGIALSYLFDPAFLEHYFGFGSTVGVSDSWAMKFLSLPAFLRKMMSRTAGTYYLADIRPALILGGVGHLFIFVTLLYRLIFKKFREQSAVSMPYSDLLIQLPAILFGTALIGKYGPPSIGFIVPPLYLCAAAGLYGIYGVFLEHRSRQKSVVTRDGGPIRYKRLVSSAGFLLVMLLPASATVLELRHSLSSRPYGEYRRFLAKSIEEEGRILVNLNGAFAFSYDRLVLWRDLAQLSDSPGALERFLHDQDVRWIAVPEELELIYESRPIWNGVYGNPRWYPQLAEILVHRGELIAEETFPRYAMRLVPYMERKDWTLKIYRIEKACVSPSE